MKFFLNTQQVRILELLTMFVAIVGIALTVLHGNLYDYFFNLFAIPYVTTFSLLYLSLLLYSILALVIFSSLFLFNEKNATIRLINYIQGWLFIVIATSAYEWLENLMLWGTQIVLAGRFSDGIITYNTKKMSVIFFSALFVIWILEKKKNQILRLK